MLVAPHDVSRVIARPFDGRAGRLRRARRTVATTRSSRRRKRCSTRWQRPGVPRAGVGKVDDLFAGRAITVDAHGVERRGHRGHRRVASGRAASGLLFANLVDFDQLFGHRNDVAGFYGALREFDARSAGHRCSTLREDDLLFITADHGNDPTTPSTDHARECVPLLAVGRRVRAA